jgi:diguanylate cyclase (GGDEF)-like protein
MSTYSSGWSTQQLAEFLTAIAAYADRASALQGAVERVAEALEAEVAAIVRDDEVLATVGFPKEAVPAALLCAAGADSPATIAIPALGVCHLAVISLESPNLARLLVARTGGSEFTREEGVLLRAMGRSLGLTMRSLAALEEERELRARSEAQIRENLRLVHQLQERQLLLERLAKIGRSISHRAPFGEVLDTIVRGASELVNTDIASFRLRDDASPDSLVILKQVGVPQSVVDEMAFEPASRGASGRSIISDQLVVISDYPRFPGAVAALVRFGLQVAMAAPVRENGRVVGSLTVGSREAGRVFTQAEQETLVAFAEHASLALTDSKMSAAMQHQALHDALTDLPNRTLFLDRLGHALARARREEGSVTGVLFIDLDRFKNVNDSLGHDAGDQLLIQVGRRLRGSIREADTPARLGGDEFAVLLEGQSVTGAAKTARKLLRSLEPAIDLAADRRRLGASIGIAMASVADPDAVVAAADAAMYEAKRAGGGYRVSGAAEVAAL